MRLTAKFDCKSNWIRRSSYGVSRKQDLGFIWLMERCFEGGEKTNTRAAANLRAKNQILPKTGWVEHRPRAPINRSNCKVRLEFRGKSASPATELKKEQIGINLPPPSIVNCGSTVNLAHKFNLISVCFYLKYVAFSSDGTPIPPLVSNEPRPPATPPQRRGSR